MIVRFRPTAFFFLSGLCAFVVHAATSDLDAPMSLGLLEDYGRQRDCAKSCYYNGAWDNIGYAIGCSRNVGNGYLSQNLCYCRADLQAQAERIISSCVYSSCSKNPIDISTATSLYKAYCTPKVAPQNDAITTAATTTAAATAVTTTGTSALTSKSAQSLSLQTVTITASPTAPTITATLPGTTKVLVGATVTASSNLATEKNSLRFGWQMLLGQFSIYFMYIFALI